MKFKRMRWIGLGAILCLSAVVLMAAGDSKDYWWSGVHHFTQATYFGSKSISATGVMDLGASTVTSFTSTGAVTLDDGSGVSPDLILTDGSDETATFEKADSGYLKLTTLAADGFNILTGNLKVGNGTPATAQNGEDFYAEGTSEIGGTLRVDGAATIIGAATIHGLTTLNGDLTTTGTTTAVAVNASGALTLDDNSGASPDLTLTDQANETAVFSKVNSGFLSLTTAAARGLNVLTGNLKVGNGTPFTAQDGEDFYAEGAGEVGETLRVDGAATIIGAATFHGATVLNGGASTTGTLTAGTVAVTGNGVVNGTFKVHGATTLNGAVTTTGTATAATVIATGELTGMRKVITITTSTLLTDAQCKGTIVYLAAAQDDTTITVTMPTLVAGYDVTFVDNDLTSGADLIIQMGSADTINGGTAAKKYIHGSGSTAKGVAHFVAADVVDFTLVSPPLEAGAVDTVQWRNDNS